jgi:hypothetical protein
MMISKATTMTAQFTLANRELCLLAESIAGDYATAAFERAATIN